VPWSAKEPHSEGGDEGAGKYDSSSEQGPGKGGRETPWRNCIHEHDSAYGPRIRKYVLQLPAVRDYVGKRGDQPAMLLNLDAK